MMTLTLRDGIDAALESQAPLTWQEITEAIWPMPVVTPNDRRPWTNGQLNLGCRIRSLLSKMKHEGLVSHDPKRHTWQSV